jgi:hypothetical protein
MFHGGIAADAGFTVKTGAILFANRLPNALDQVDTP